MVSAGHCTFGTGLNGEPTESGAGGNDVWISFAEEPDYSILRPSSEFIPDDNEGRYVAWSAALNASAEWIRATAYPHPDYDDLRRGHPAAGGAAAGQPQRGPGRRHGHGGEAFQRRQHRRHLLG